MRPGRRHPLKRKGPSKVAPRAQPEAFDFEDPAIPEVWAIMDSTRPELEEIHDALRDLYRVDVAFPELDPERLAVIKKVARWPRQEIAVTDLGSD